jgi:hypothetical protein
MPEESGAKGVACLQHQARVSHLLEGNSCILDFGRLMGVSHGGGLSYGLVRWYVPVNQIEATASKCAQKRLRHQHEQFVPGSRRLYHRLGPAALRCVC